MRMHVPLASLGTLLDLPAPVSVVGIDVAAGSVSEGYVELYLEGVDLNIASEVVTAEYSVDAKGHRRFLCFKAPEPEPEVPVTETVGATTPAERPRPTTKGKAGS